VKPKYSVRRFLNGRIPTFKRTVQRLKSYAKSEARLEVMASKADARAECYVSERVGSATDLSWPVIGSETICDFFQKLFTDFPNFVGAGLDELYKVFENQEMAMVGYVLTA
jgi:hypothetical protein